MYINISESETGNNKGSSAQLVHYLDKENRRFDDQPVEQWFNHVAKEIPSYEVKSRIDSNIAKLGRLDAKFFLLNISPSQKEIAHLKSLYGEVGARQQLKVFAEKIMDEYAMNFRRKGIDGKEELLWFAKLENHRYYSFRDKEVKSGAVKAGEQKSGEQMHVQVIVSRKDLSNRIKLSPMNKSRGRNKQHSLKVGEFDRVAFKASGERVFDETFGFERPLSESFQYVNAQVNGSLAERIAMQGRVNQAAHSNNEQHASVGNEKILPKEQERSENLLDLLLARPDYDPLAPMPKKKRRRKGKDQGLNF